MKFFGLPQSYIDRYNYEHTPVMGAVDEHANVAFSLHVDKVCTACMFAHAESTSP